MRRRLRLVSLCLAALLAVRMMAQDTGGGGGGGGGNASGAAGDSSGTTTPDNSSGGTTSPDNSGSSNTNGGTSNGTSSPNGGAGNGTGTGGEGGTGTTTATGTQGGEGLPVAPTPPTALPPGTAVPIPGMTPAPTPAPTPIGPNTYNPAAQGAGQAAPVTFSVPGGYGGTSAPQTLTLGQGRLAKPPITFSLSVTEGYNNNLNNAPSHYQTVPTPTPRPTATPPLEARIISFRIQPPYPPTAVLQFFRPKASPTPAIPTVPTQAVIGSASTTASLGAQVQVGTPRTALTLDLSVGEQYYYNQPGGGNDFTGSFDINLVHRLTPRATFSIEGSATYQNTPNFALVNAPTNTNSTGSYLNGNIKTDLTYNWSDRIATVTSYSLGFNILESTASNNQYGNTFGTQFRYTVSARNTLTAELRESVTVYPSSSGQNNSSTYYLLGLDSFLSSRLRNTFSAGYQTFSGTIASQSLPYFESTTTLGLQRGAGLSWTNSYGIQQPGAPSESVTSYRTGLTYSQPLSAKLVASLSVAFNNVKTTDSSMPADASTQNQFQASASLNYTLSPRFSLSLSYTFLDLLSSAINSSYTDDQVFLGASYLFR